MTASPLAASKEHAGRLAATMVEAGMRVGLGTGSTVHFTIVALGEREAAEGLDLTCVATSDRTEALAREVGLRVVPPGAVEALDVAVDGADEIDPHWNLVKGGGGAHAREKVVADLAARFVVVVDEHKRVDRLGAFRIPLEVLDFAVDTVPRRLAALGVRHVEPRGARSDNGNPLLDADFGLVDDPVALAHALDGVPGLVDHGIFPARMVHAVIVGTATGAHELAAPRS